MATQPGFPTHADVEVRASWLPMIVIAMGQALMSFNTTAGSGQPERDRANWGDARHRR
jgi:hypothetical protein